MKLPKHLTSDLGTAARTQDGVTGTRPEKGMNHMKTYLVQIELDGEVSSKMMTERELADHWETDDIAGIGYKYSAFNVDTFGQATAVNVYNIVQEVLAQKRWMEQEYMDYCENVREYGLDFEMKG